MQSRHLGTLVILMVAVFSIGSLGSRLFNLISFSPQSATGLSSGVSVPLSGQDMIQKNAVQKLLMVGGYGTSSPFADTWSTNDPSNGSWSQLVGSGSWNNPYATKDPEVAYFDNKIWLVGQNANVWSSSDGATWIQSVKNAPFGARQGQKMVVFPDGSSGDALWLIGGNLLSSGVDTNDVWKSHDGVVWTQVTARAPFAPRKEHAVVIFDNKMWVLGGSTRGGQTFNDVWSTSNGIDWTQTANPASWAPREGHGALSFDNKLWVIGGSNMSDVWSSSDGITWKQVVSNASWPQRHHFASAVFNNKMWVFGGIQTITSPSVYGDAWYSVDGVSWVKAPVSSWIARHSLSVVSVPRSFGLDIEAVSLSWQVSVNGIPSGIGSNNAIFSSVTDPYVYFSAVIRNNSGVPLVLPSTTTFTLYEGSVDSSHVIVPDISLGTPGSLTLPAHATFVVNFKSPTLRRGPQTYNLILKADSTGMISESNENNNMVLQTLTIR